MTYDPHFHIVLHEPQIPPNTGNVARTCVALQAKLWLVRPLGFQVDDHAVRRAGLDYWQALQWEVVDHWDHLNDRLNANQKWFFSTKGQGLYTEARFQLGDALIFGSETKGLPEKLLDQFGPHSLRLPQSAHVRSLNLSNTVAVAAYEWHRQVQSP